MKEAKFQPTGQSVESLIESIDHKGKQQDSYILLDLFEKVTGRSGIVWYPGIIGFGRYQYEYESGHKGIGSLLAFAPRKSKFSLYLGQDFPEREILIEQLGKCKPAVGCIYVNKLADIDLEVLQKMLENSLAHTETHYQILD